MNKYLVWQRLRYGLQLTKAELETKESILDRRSAGWECLGTIELGPVAEIELQEQIKP